MTNTFNTIQGAPGIIARAAAKMLSDELQFCKSIAKADPQDYSGKNGYSAGDTIYISKPARFLPQDTFDITSTQQAIVEEKVPLVLDTISTIGVNIDSFEYATKIALEETLKRVVKPAVQSIAQDIESRFLVKAKNAVYNTVGTPGSTTYDTDLVLSARERMNKFLCPKTTDQRFCLFESTAMRSAVNARKGLFQSATNISEQYKNGYIGQSDGVNWMENELLPVHTNGNDVTFEVSTTVVTEGATQIVVEGLTLTTGTVTKGTTFTIAGVYAVHPITKTQYPFLQQFVVTADATANGSGIATLNVSPAIYTSASAGLQNVSAFPTDGATCTVQTGSASTGYTNTFAFHKDAFRMVSVPLIMPTKAEIAVQETYQGITVAIIRDFDIKTRKMITRLDFLGGFVADRPEWACRLVS